MDKDKKKYQAAAAQLRKRLHQQPERNKLERSPKKIIFLGLIGFSFIIFIFSLMQSFQKRGQHYLELKNAEKIRENGPIHQSTQKGFLELKATSDAKACTLPSNAEAGLKKALARQSTQTAYPIEVQNDLGMHFRFIPLGEFQMGTSVDNDFEYLHRQFINQDFYAGKFEVTQEQWNKVMKKNPSWKKGPQLPVTNIPLIDAQRFIARLNKRYKLPPKTYDLMTEAEWEYICRAGSQSDYYFGKDNKLLLFYAHFRGNEATLKTAGKTLPNTWGLYNMHDNVSEWTKTPFSYYQCGPEQYAEHLDRPIYDGDWPQDQLTPLDNFKVKTRTYGIAGKLFFADLDKDFQFSDGDFIWQDSDNGRPGLFDATLDLIIYDSTKKRPYKVLDGIKGSQSRLLFADSNNNKTWNHGEAIWSYSPQNRSKDLLYSFRGGNYAVDGQNCRSARRWKLNSLSSADFLGLRIIRRIKNFKAQNK